ncbi:ribonuclease H2, subunit C [Mycena galericulata]|nr:ribonuclease H2, subunit C [Mycena galericulata]
MAAPTLSITAIPSLVSLPNASPNLMPFHIEHDGPAPIATYFLVEAASEHVGKPPPLTEAKPTEDTEMATETDTTLELEGAVPTPREPPTLSRRVTDATTRFIATFRGRTMQGLKVELPPGYTGVIMVGEGGGKVNALKTKIKRVTAKARSKSGRAMRSATRADDEDEMEEPQEGDQATRALMPTAQFSSFVMWHPDIPRSGERRISTVALGMDSTS